MRVVPALAAALDRRGWVTWERRRDDAQVLMVTNAWPRPGAPALGIFVQGTVDGLEAAGVRCDVLVIHGYRGPHAYLAGALLLALLPLWRRYELVNTHAGEAALAGRFYWGGPVLASYWGSDLLGPQVGPTRQRRKVWLSSRLMRAHARLMTATSTKSIEMQEVLPRRVRARNWVIPDGVDRTRFVPGDQAAARAALGWPAEGLIAVSVGRRHPLKRLDLAQTAVEAARRSLPSLRWIGVSDLTPAQMPLVYRAADCLVHTSLSEGSPNAVKEALACDLPVVATASGDIRQLLAGVEPSAVCPADPGALAAAIVACLAPPRRSNGRAMSVELGSEAIAERVRRCYRSLGVSV
jgi:glycosyltransferase involved in cell wall biosynthesis